MTWDVFNQYERNVKPTNLVAVVGCTDSRTSSATDCNVTLPAVTGQVGHIGAVYWSYSGNPTNGRLTISDGSVSILDLDITTGGPGFLPFNHPFSSTTSNQSLAVKLFNGAVTGKLTVRGWYAK